MRQFHTWKLNLLHRFSIHTCPFPSFDGRIRTDGPHVLHMRLMAEWHPSIWRGKFHSPSQIHAIPFEYQHKSSLCISNSDTRLLQLHLIPWAIVSVQRMFIRTILTSKKKKELKTPTSIALHKGVASDGGHASSDAWQLFIHYNGLRRIPIDRQNKRKKWIQQPKHCFKQL